MTWTPELDFIARFSATGILLVVVAFVVHRVHMRRNVPIWIRAFAYGVLPTLAILFMPLDIAQLQEWTAGLFHLDSTTNSLVWAGAILVLALLTLLRKPTRTSTKR